MISEAVREMTFEEAYENLQKDVKELFKNEKDGCEPPFANCVVRTALRCITKLKEQVPQWIPVSERLPKPENKALIVTAKGNITTAMYEDGTMYESDSCWFWSDCDFEYDEEHDDYIISKGWWEWKELFNYDDCYDHAVDENVIAWMPLPAPYKESE